MLTHTLRTATRSLARQWGTTAVNVAGLALACSVALLLAFITRELVTFDRGYDGADDVHIVLQDIETAGGTRSVNDTWVPLLPAIGTEIPAVEAGTRVHTVTHQIEADERLFSEQRVSYADAGFFQVFPFPFLRGDARTAFADPNAAVLSPATADALFGDADPIGQTLVLDGTHSVTVAGVAEPQPNSSVRFDVLVNWPHAEQHVGGVRDYVGSWDSSFLQTYLRLQSSADPEAAESTLTALFARESAPETSTIRLAQQANRVAEWYGFDTFAAVFALLALGVLLMAVANFTNLATAQSLGRAREIGVRKTLGASRGGLAVGFFAEAGLVAMASVLIGLALAGAASPWVNGLLPPEAGLAVRIDLSDGWLWAGVGGLVALLTALAGAYPALFLSRFAPTDVLLGTLAARPAGKRLRSGLVVFQFALTVLLLTSALTIHRQVQHMGGFGVDFGATPIVVVPLSPDAFTDEEAAANALRRLRDDLRQNAAVAEASLSTTIPGAYYYNSMLDMDQDEQRFSASISYVDSHYLALYGVEPVAGAGFDAFAQEGQPRFAIVNQAAVTAAGWDGIDDRTIRPGGETVWEVVGRTDDVALKNLRDPVGPAVHILDPEVAFGFLSVRSATSDPGPVLALLNERWAETGATRALTSFFADESYARETLGQETALRGLVGYAAFFAALIALMGLAGLATLAAIQRTKEVGIRKALGATTSQVILLLTRGMSGLVVLGAALAAPLAVIGMGAWLEQYPHRIALGPGPLLFVSVGVLVVAVAVIALQTLRTATTDPVRALRSE